MIERERDMDRERKNRQRHRPREKERMGDPAMINGFFLRHAHRFNLFIFFDELSKVTPREKK